MGRVPETIQGLGDTREHLRQNPDFDPNVYDFDRDSYFIWSRLDGHTSTRDVILMVGFALDHTVAILKALRAAGAVLRAHETPAHVADLLAAFKKERAERLVKTVMAAASTPAVPPREAPPEEAKPRARPATVPPAAALRAGGVADRPSGGDGLRDMGSSSALTEEEIAAMAAAVDLDTGVRERIIAMRRKVRTADYFALLDVSQDVDNRTLKRTYFRLSKEFHPDRYYRKNTGPFGPWLAQIFETLSKAFEVLSDQAARQRYVSSLTGEHRALSRQQSREEYARELFGRACSAENQGNQARALELFAAAIRLDAQAKYLGRAARCATHAGKLEVAAEYAKKAAELEPESPSVARILADVYRAAGNLASAEDTLVHALRLKSENDVLGQELAADLAAVRAARAREDDHGDMDDTDPNAP